MASKLEWSINLNPLRLAPMLELQDMEARTNLALTHLQDLGVGYVRMDLLMSWLMPSPGEVNMTAIAWYQGFISRLTDAGIAVLAVLYNPPPWACKLAERDSRAFLPVWREYCRLIRQHLPGLRVFQIWNEPNNYFSHLKGDFNFFRRKRLALGKWGVSVPTGVEWETLSALFRIAREELPDGSLLVYNVLASLSSYVPLSLPTWTEWDHFSDRLLEEAGDNVDAIAVDHYPETWIPGAGSLEWAPVQTLIAKVNDPSSVWYRKTALVGEVGYSSCRNVDLLHHRIPLKFFSNDHTQESMATWFAESLTYLVSQLRPERLPHNRLHLINVYELYDGAVSFVGDRPDRKDLVGIEHHFGLLDSHLKPKAAYPLFKEIVGGRPTQETASRKATTGPVDLYFKGSRVSKAVSRAMVPPLGKAYQAMRPMVRKRDLGYLSAGALFVLYQLWRGAGSAGSDG